MNTNPNRLGVKGWVYAGKYSFERYLYLGHRLSGLGLIAYMVLHIIETANRIRGEHAWAELMALFASPPFRVIELAPPLRFRGRSSRRVPRAGLAPSTCSMPGPER